MNLKDVDLRQVYNMWKSDLKEFQCFFRSSPFVSLQTYDDFSINEDIKQELYPDIINDVLKCIDEKSFIIIDLPLEQILDLALSLNNEHYIKPILNVNLLFHPYGIVGTKTHINKIIINSSKLEKIESNKYVMLLPYDRFDEKIESKDMANKLNNQYGVGEDDLPYGYMLKKLGYDKLILMTGGVIKEDLVEYIDYMKKDIDVEVIKVG